MLVLALEQIQFRQLCLALAQRLLLARQRLHRLVGRFVGKAGYMLHGPGTSSHVRTPGVTASTLSRSEEHTSELQSLMRISYAVFCLKKKKKHKEHILQITQNDTQANIKKQVNHHIT